MQTGYDPVVPETLPGGSANVLRFATLTTAPLRFPQYWLFFFGSETFLLVGTYFWFSFRGVSFWGAGIATGAFSMTCEIQRVPTLMCHICICETFVPRGQSGTQFRVLKREVRDAFPKAVVLSERTELGVLELFNPGYV